MPDEMLIRDFLFTVGSTYDRKDVRGLDQPAQILMKNAPQVYGNLVPTGFKIGVSGQPNFQLPITPWIGFLNPDESSSFQDGIYVVYLFDAELSNVFLSLNQGTENLRKNEKMSLDKQIKTLVTNATKIRSAFTNTEILDLDNEIDLKKSSGRPRTYVAGNIVAKKYSVANLPSTEQLEHDLLRFFELYDRALLIKNNLVLDKESDFVGIYNDPTNKESQGLGGFNPKNDSEYEVEIKARKIVKSRRHESLVKIFGEYVQERGFTAHTPHPIDVLIIRDGIEWIVEAKIIYNLNTAQGVRAAIGQLFEYRHFLRPNARQVALFDRPIEGAFLGLLSSLDITTIYVDHNGWKVHSKDPTIQSFLK